jgi:hypothetical protein
LPAQCVTSLSAPVGADANDFGFETPPVGTGPSAYQYNPSGSPWTFTGLSGVAGNGSDMTIGNPNAPQGTQVAFLQLDSSISQAVTFDAGTYDLSFSSAQRFYNVSRQTFQVQIDGAVVGIFTLAGVSYDTYNTTGFTVTAGRHTISFVGLDPDGQDNTAFIDQVHINRAQVVPVNGGGFETPALGSGPTAYQYNPSGSPWTFSGTSGVSGNGSLFTDGNPDAPEGSQVAFLQDYGSISQVTNFAAGTYSLSFLAAQRANGNDSSQTFQVEVDGIVVGVFTPVDTNYSPYTTSSFTVTAGHHTIRFVGLDPDGQENTVLIDQVSLIQ